MNNTFRTIKGTKDILPIESDRWRKLENVIHDTMKNWGYGEIRTPVFEQTGLFERSVGKDSDIVSKQMYTFMDQSKMSLTLRPELTAPTMRAYIQHNMERDGAMTKIYYMDTLFRQERPQAGRLRQFSQFGAEAIGSPNPEQDAEVISLLCNLLDKLNVEKYEVVINSIGSASSKESYRTALVNYLTPFKNDLSNTSKERLVKNPLRILDTKDEKEISILHDAPDIMDFLNSEDLKHFEALKKFLSQLGVDYKRDKRLVRGLDYYTKTTFEILNNSLGAQNALCGGGRYDKLIERLGGKSTPAVGFAVGIERILLAMSQQNEQKNNKPSIYIVCASNDSRDSVINLTDEFRKSGLSTNFDTLRRSVKAQLREANRLSSTHAIFLGDEELSEGSVKIKDLDSGEQVSIAMKDILSYFQD
jgi:histidyl-tRNA synthetase|tara:strand:+ start:259 stop:1512 length:1254 start_codon:yes stop_codon:yes gene_type:complete